MIYIPLFVALGLLPSIIWLLFYLRKDVHPEPKRMVLVFFLFGMIISMPAAFVENSFALAFGEVFHHTLLGIFLYYLLGIALIEELSKYFAFRLGIAKNPEFDEPTDALIYMIIIALGFAAVENILLLFPTTAQVFLEDALIIALFRFVTATILHALASANIGFFFALSLYNTKKRKGLLFSGVCISIFLHALYNFATNIEGKIGATIIVGIIGTLFLVVLWEFAKIRKIKSVCVIKN